MKKLRNIVKILMTFFIIQNNERKGFNTITNKNLAESRFQLNSDIDNKFSWINNSKDYQNRIINNKLNLQYKYDDFK